jgi:prepilin-type processing-associated H-X9-DG protein
MRVARHGRRAAAFTLVELLAVIAIILILIMLLFPAFGVMRERSWRVICLNNIRQQQVAFSNYAVQNDGKIPCGATSIPDPNDPGNYFPDGYFPTNIWTDTLDLRKGEVWDYIRDERTYSCPALPPWLLNKEGANTYFKRHYSVNAFINATKPEVGGWWNGGPPKYSARTLSQIKNHSGTLCLIEEYDWRSDRPGMPGPVNTYCIGLGDVWIDAPPYWHDYGANFGFIDGHVEFKAWKGPKMRTVVLTKWGFNVESWAATDLDKQDFAWMKAGITNGYIW